MSIKRFSFLCLAKRPTTILFWVLTITLAALMSHSTSAPAQSVPATEGTEATRPSGHHLWPALTDENTPTVRPDGVRLSPKQRKAIVQANLEKSKNDAAEMAALAKALREALEKQNENVLTSEVILRVERIEKLAKRIREETKGM